MSCQELFESLAVDKNKAEKIDIDKPACLCEQVSVSRFSKDGPVQQDEIIWRLILSPIHYDTDTGKVKEFAFSDVWDKGMSVLRERILGSRAKVIERGQERAALKEECVFECAIGAIAEKIRSIRSIDSEGRFCIYDTAEEFELAHADICQTRHKGKTAQKQLRRELHKLFIDLQIK